MEKKNEKPVIKINLITGKANLIKAIGQVNVTGKALETLIHTVAVSVLAHIEQHREVSLANQLIDAVPVLARKNALRDWFVSFGKIKFDTETKLMAFNKTGKTDIVTATQNPFYTFVPEKEYQPMDLLAAITVLVNRADKALEKGNKKDKIPADKLDVLRKLVA